MSLDILSYSIASGMPVALTIVKCWNINHKNHKHTYFYEPHDQNDKSNRYYTLYDCDDWYFRSWQLSMPLEFCWQLSNWVGPMCLDYKINQSESIKNLQKNTDLKKHFGKIETEI